MADFKISVSRPPGRRVGGRVHVQLPNGHEFDREFVSGFQALHFAEGIREGFMLALNAIGFVPAVDNQLMEKV